MSTVNQMSVSLVGVGGAAPYAFTVVAGENTTIPATISGALLTVDASTLEPGNYTVEVLIADSTGATSTKIIAVEVLDQTKFAILNRDATYEPNVLPAATTLQLNSVGGSGAVTWALIPGVTTLPGTTLSGSTLSFTLTSFGRWAIGVRATDALGNTVTRVLTVAVVAAAVVAVVDGHASLQVAATTDQIGAHQFTLTIQDASLTAVSSTFHYNVEDPLSDVDLTESAIDHFWGAGDTTSVVYPIAGELSGFSLGTTTPVVAANGLTVSVDPSTNSLVVTGPPTSFGNAEVEVPIAVVQGSTQVATITREFTLVSHSGTTDIGSMTCSTRPYIVGEVVGLNPERPYFNSPSIFKNQGYTVQLVTGSTLPLGLSLDSRTGLIYGTVLAADVLTSVLQYVDANGVVHGSITVKWDIITGQFQLVDALPDGEIQAAYNGSLTSSSSSALSSASVYRGQLPTGLLLSISADKTRVTLSGTPTVAGYFDLWIKVTNANGLVAFIQKRLVIDYTAPLAVLTDSLQRMVTGFAFSQLLRAVGGVQPYTWAVVGGTLPAGVTLNASTGLLQGTPTASSYNQTITFQVTDARGVSSTRALRLTINNALAITTPVLPLLTPGQFYQFQLIAEGGQGAYVWALGAGSAALPGGFSLSSGGVLSGATSLQAYSANIIVQVTDAANNVATQTFPLSIGTTSGLTIDTEGVAPIVRGLPYQGVLKVLGTGTAPYTWSVTPDSPNPLPTGLTLTTDQSDQGATATLAGTTSQILLYDAVKVQVVDNNGNSAFAFLLLNTYSSLVITTTSLPQATVNGSYSVQLAATGINTPFTWELDPSSPGLPSGMTFSSSGLLSGTPTGNANLNLIFRVTDAFGDYTAKPFNFAAISSNLSITSATLPQGTSGVPYSATLAATGGTPGYAWSISPSSANVLPSGLSLNAATGVISGTTLAQNYSKPITFRVTDSIGVYREVALTLAVASGLTLVTGPDYVQGTTLGYLGIVSRGDVSSINPRPNRSFDVVATRVVSTSPSNISFGLPPGFSAAVLSLSGGVAVIGVTGPFSSGAPGDNTFTFSMLDSGVNGSASFKWRVYTEQAISIVPASGSLPALYS